MTWVLIKQEFLSLFGINRFLHTRDSLAKKKQAALGAIVAAVILGIMVQLAAQSYGLIHLGGAELVPQLQTVAAGMVIFLFSMFDRVLYSRKGYEILHSFPIKPGSIALSRTAKAYAKSFFLGLGILLPGTGVYALMESPSWDWYLRIFAGFAVVPVLPLSLSMVFDMAISGISSRSKRPGTVQIFLTAVLLLAVFTIPLAMTELPAMPKSPEQMVAAVNQVVTALAPAYLRTWSLSFRSFFAFLTVSLAAGAVSWVLVSHSYGEIMDRISSPVSSHSSCRWNVPQKSMLGALYEKEARGYFHCPVYVTNTIIGPVLSVVFSFILLFIQKSAMEKTMGFSLDDMLPLIWCAIATMMGTSSVSISMEGSRAWILKTMPVPMKELILAKLLWNLTLTVPAYVLSLPLLLWSRGGANWGWYLLVPPAMLIFSAVFGITANLHLQNLKWEKETEVVKQSAAGGVGGLVPGLLAVILALGAGFFPSIWVKCGMIVLLLGSSALMLLHCRRARLNDL